MTERATRTPWLTCLALLALGATLASAEDAVARARRLLAEVERGRATARAFHAALEAAQAQDARAGDALLVQAAFAAAATTPRRPALPLASLLARLDAAALGHRRGDVERAVMAVHRLWWRTLPERGWRRDTAADAHALAGRIRRDLRETARSVVTLREHPATAWWGEALAPFLHERLQAAGDLEVTGGGERISLADVVREPGAPTTTPDEPARGGLAGGLSGGVAIEVLDLAPAHVVGGRVTATLRLRSPDAAPLRGFSATLSGGGTLVLESGRLPAERAADVTVDLPAPTTPCTATLSITLTLADGREHALDVAVEVAPRRQPRRLP